MSSTRRCRRCSTGPGWRMPRASRGCAGGWWPRYLPDRAELTGILGQVTAGLFGAAAGAAGKRTWCEKTPFNLLSVPFLLELFPRGDGRGDHAASGTGGGLAPGPAVGVARSGGSAGLAGAAQRWLAQRPVLLQHRRYVEVKAEDLAAHWPDGRRELFGRRLGLPDADTASGFAASRLASRRARP
jgi:omega-hydroxy-beta-dihydromenaquinone-9 sulfotransferase